jgi:hypothetical protein
VIAYARSDWTRVVTHAEALSYPAFGLDLGNLQLGMLQYGPDSVSLNYGTKAEPGHVAIEMSQVSKVEATRIHSPMEWTACGGANGDSGQVRTFLKGDRAVSVLVHSWAIEQGVVSLDTIGSALVRLGQTEGATVVKPPVVNFNGDMPLPSGSDFGTLLAGVYR